MTSTNPYLYYVDAGAAMDWLVEAFGFVEAQRQQDESGAVNHGQLDTPDGEGSVMVGAPGDDYRNPASLGGITCTVFVTVPDVDQHHATAVAAGATVSSPLAEREYGRSYMATDPEGHSWTFVSRG